MKKIGYRKEKIQLSENIFLSKINKYIYNVVPSPFQKSAKVNGAIIRII